MPLTPTDPGRILSILLSSEKYCDLTITCGDRSFRVLRALICPQSEFFEKACDGPFKEGSTRIINLPDDDPDDIARMISFMYGGSYEFTRAAALLAQVDPDECPASNQNPKVEEKQLSSNAEKTGTSTALTDDSTTVTTTISDENFVVQKQLGHARMYALGEKYLILELKKFASDSFKGCPSSTWRHGAAEILRTVYTSTPTSDRTLRSIVVNVCAKFTKNEAENVGYRKILEEIPDARFDILEEQLCIKEASILNLQAQLSLKEAKICELQQNLSLKGSTISELQSTIGTLESRERSQSIRINMLEADKRNYQSSMQSLRNQNTELRQQTMKYGRGIARLNLANNGRRL